MLYQKVLSFLYCLAVVSLLSAQSPWVREKHGYYAQLGYLTIPTTTELHSFLDKPYVLNRAVTESTVQLYGEYGVDSRLTAILSLPYVFTSTDSEIQPNSIFPNNVLPAGSFSGFGNIQLGAKYKLFKHLPITFNLMTSLPTASYQAATGLRTGFDALGVTPSLSAGMSGKRYYVFTNFGGTYRTNNYSTSTFVKVEAGRKFGDLYAIVVFDRLRSSENGTYNDGNSLQTGLSPDKQSWSGFGIKLNYQIKERYGITLWGFGALGNLVQMAPSVGLSVYVKSVE